VCNRRGVLYNGRAGDSTTLQAHVPSHNMLPVHSEAEQAHVQCGIAHAGTINLKARRCKCQSTSRRSQTATIALTFPFAPNFVTLYTMSGCAARCLCTGSSGRAAEHPPPSPITQPFIVGATGSCCTSKRKRGNQQSQTALHAADPQTHDTGPAHVLVSNQAQVVADAVQVGAAMLARNCMLTSTSTPHALQDCKAACSSGAR
jgi:hypothetical protein